METHIQLIKEQDFNRVVELTNKAYSVPYKLGRQTTRANDTLDKIKGDIERGVIIFTAFVDDKIVGAVRCEQIDNFILLYKLVVDSVFRNKGIGGKLVKSVFQYSSDNNINKVKIEVSEEKGLIPYYESFGFTISDRYFNKDHHEVSMIKNFH